MTVATGSCKSRDDKAWPPGFRFHPTDEELVLYYLKRKICRRRLRLDIIRELDVYKWDPEELPGQSILKSGDRQWFFFSPRDRKYPNGARSNRATRQGYWKATGKDRNVTMNSRNVGVKKTLVFYRGRAPSGERTDWVMHEYTLDEEELKRCPNIKEYYALYKVYKKSGPGPKNGEQYGAPFKEEDWADDECLVVDKFVTPVNQANIVTPPVVDNTKTSTQVDPQLNDFENFMKLIADEDPVDLPVITDYINSLPKVTCNEETQSTLMDPSIREITFVEPISASPPSCEQYDVQANQTATSKLHSLEAPEISSVPSNSEQVPHFCEEDFLEIDDLMGPEPALCKAENPGECLEVDDFDGLADFDLYHDSAMFFREMGPADQETVSHVNQVGFGPQPHSMGNQVEYQGQSHFMGNQVEYQSQSFFMENQMECQPEPHSMANQMGYQIETHSSANNVDYMYAEAFGADELWLNDLTTDVFTTPEPVQGTLSQPNPGMSSETKPTGANQNQNGGEEEDGSSSWISSTLWGFLESIPTTPASASESPLVNKAFERMSSFSRMKLINVRNSSISGDNVIIRNGSANANARRDGGSGNRGFIILSILGILCAVLWVVVGGVRFLGRAIFS